MSEAATPFRPRPRVTALTHAFWRGGAGGALLIVRCDDCGYFVHPPGPVCPRCTSRALTPTAVSGDAHVVSFTVNHQAWYPGWETPYAVAIVELVEQPGLRLTTNVVGCDPHAVHIGMPVHLRFEALPDPDADAAAHAADDDTVWLPLFTPAPEAAP